VTVPDEYERRLTVWSDIQGHLKFLHDTVTAYANPVVIELGVAWGNSTSALLSAAAETDGMLWSVDAGEVRTTHMIPEDWWDDPHWRFLHADDLSARALEWLPPECDVLFADSDHSYSHVTGILGAYMPRVRPGGVALFHDTQWQYPDTDLGRPEGDISRALSDWCGKHDATWENRPGSYGLGIIRP
jgi:predicted O-methyltransferase YrrM